MFDGVNDEMFEMGDMDMPLHLEMSKWHITYAENDIAMCDLQFTEASVAKLLMSSQRLMNELDPDNFLDANSVRTEVWGLPVMEDYKKRFKQKNNDYTTMRLQDIMDLYFKFHYVAYKEPDWSVVDWVALALLA